MGFRQLRLVFPFQKTASLRKKGDLKNLRLSKKQQAEFARQKGFQAHNQNTHFHLAFNNSPFPMADSEQEATEPQNQAQKGKGIEKLRPQICP